MTLVDTNIVIDILSQDPTWFAWSAARLEDIAIVGPALINEVTYAELAVRIADEADLRLALMALNLKLERAPDHALFLAGRSFAAYRAAGGPRSSLLPDFFIGAHAEVDGLPILTRDPRRYRTYFPRVTLISP